MRERLFALAFASALDLAFALDLASALDSSFGVPVVGVVVGTQIPSSVWVDRDSRRDLRPPHLWAFASLASPPQTCHALALALGIRVH